MKHIIPEQLEQETHLLEYFAGTYGDYVSGKRVITDNTRKEMKSILNDIQSGTFVKNWMLENKINQPNFKAMRKKAQLHEIEKVGKRWIQEQA